MEMNRNDLDRFRTVRNGNDLDDFLERTLVVSRCGDGWKRPAITGGFRGSEMTSTLKGNSSVSPCGVIAGEVVVRKLPHDDILPRQQ